MRSRQTAVVAKDDDNGDVTSRSVHYGNALLLRYSTNTPPQPPSRRLRRYWKIKNNIVTVLILIAFGSGCVVLLLTILLTAATMDFQDKPLETVSVPSFPFHVMSRNQGTIMPVIRTRSDDPPRRLAVTRVVNNTSTEYSPLAYPVIGTVVQYEQHKGGDSNLPSPITVVYALPSTSVTQQKMGVPGGQSVASFSSSLMVNGIVLLLHACTHNAYKFFSPSSSSSDQCQECVGLSEELQIVRHILEHGYVALAVSSIDQKSGCWRGGGSNNNDQDQDDMGRIRYVLRKFVTETHPELWLDVNHSHGSRITTSTTPKVYAFGASSGGAMAARLLANGLVDGALVMVMGISDQLLDAMVAKSKTNPTTSTSTTNLSLYLAPMTKDQRTTQRVRDNYNYLQQQLSSQPQQANLPNRRLNVVLDETSCRPLPVTVDYLWHRVPNMTRPAAQVIVTALQEAHHLESHPSLSSFLLLDPTRSNWREVLLNKQQPFDVSSITEQQQQQPQQQYTNIDSDGGDTSKPSWLLWNTFDLTPGRSPLAKALHRAWAYHEYCSEAVPKALSLFQQTND